jgi:DNA-binding transcriptional LysR family regulator
MRLLPVSLSYFLEVARTGSVSEAAQALTVAPSAISRQIAKLEAGLGVPLFSRHPRGMELTEAGALLLAYTRRSEAEVSELVGELRAGGGADARRVAVACSEGFAHRLVPRAMAAFRRERPDVTFQLDVVTREEATRRVAEGIADVGVTYAMGAQHDVRVECSVPVPVVAVVPRGHPLAERDRIGLAEACGYPIALAPVGTSQRELFDIGTQIEGLTVHPVLVCDRVAPLYEFARAGGGLALLGDLGDLDEESTPDGVVHVRLDHPVFRQREAQVQTMPGRRLPGSAAQFTGALVAGLRRHEPRSDVGGSEG